MPEFGRLPAPDQRDWPLARAAALLPAQLPAGKYWAPSSALDQNGWPHCVAYAWKGWLLAAPVMQGAAVEPAEVYAAAQVVDEWPGEAYDGTSVRAGAKVLAERGYISSYLFASSISEARDWVLGRGPILFGTNWYSGMMQTDEAGYVAASGSLEGGHAYLCFGYSTMRRAFRCLNSWGRGWGYYGRFWLREAEAAQLLAEAGEICTALEVRI